MSSKLKNGGMCEAYGCPLSGGITLDGGEEARWFCRFHYNAGPEARDRITHKLRMHAELLHHLQLMSHLAHDVHWLLHADNADDRQQAYTIALKPKAPNETHWDYVTALEVELRRTVFGTTSAGRDSTNASIGEHGGDQREAA